MRRLRHWLTVGALLLVAACSKDKDIDTPAVLTHLPGTLKIDRVWSASVADKGAKVLRLGLSIAAEGNRVYAAGFKGEVVAFDATSGHVLWHTKLKKTPFSGGPGVGGDLVAVGTSEGEIVALEAATGKVRWRVRLNGEVLAAPAISEKAVAVRTVDGKLRALSPKDGHELWTQDQQVPRLSLRGTSGPVIAGDITLCGFDNGKVIAVNMNDGSLQWEATVAPPHGRTELERLVDVDSTPRVAGNDVFTIGFQGRIAMLALDTGQVWWSRDASSYRGVGLDGDAVYIPLADGEVVSMRQRTGAELWRQKALLHRGLSGVALTDNSVVTADFQGYVHWLDKATGELAGRARVGKTRVSNQPLVLGDLVIVVDDAGKISAFRATPISGSARAGRKTPAETAPPPPAPSTESAPPTGVGAPPTAVPAEPAPSPPPAPAEPAPTPPPTSAEPAAPPPVSPK